jgi:hypothetical protein
VGSLKRKCQSKKKKEISKSGFHVRLALKIKNKLTSRKGRCSTQTLRKDRLLKDGAIVRRIPKTEIETKDWGG